MKIKNSYGYNLSVLRKDIEKILEERGVKETNMLVTDLVHLVFKERADGVRVLVKLIDKFDMLREEDLVAKWFILGILREELDNITEKRNED